MGAAGEASEAAIAAGELGGLRGESAGAGAKVWAAEAAAAISAAARQNALRR